MGSFWARTSLSKHCEGYKKKISFASDFPIIVHSQIKLKFLQNDKEAKAFLYVDAVLHFARCGKAIEVHSFMSWHSLVAISCLVFYKFVFGLILRIVSFFISLAKWRVRFSLSNSNVLWDTGSSQVIKIHLLLDVVLMSPSWPWEHLFFVFVT